MPTSRVATALLTLFASLVDCGAAPATGPNPGASTPTPTAGISAESSATAGSSTKTPLTGEAAQAIVDAADRSKMDRSLDGGRQPAKLLEFFRIGPGMQLAELAAATGYTTELLARAVGPTGKVYGQNPRWILEQYAEKWWENRLTKPVMSNVVRVNREFDDPLPPDLRDLDAVFCVLFYHDFFWLNVDRDKVNRAVFRALKKGGIYAIVDHSARTGTEGTEAKTIHRVEEKTVRAEIEKAGFRLRAEATFLRNPSDTREWNAAPETEEEAAKRRGTSDRFVLAFEKP
ncbi:MAG TPA: SAM-dependent methyltransferase [Polyangiaceae bacterium]|nr:SAM-dependent methyltransferase [Polyangiaceae bacterium]